MGHRIVSPETFPEKSESEFFKRLGPDNVSFQVTNKWPKQDLVSSEDPFSSVAPNVLVYGPYNSDSRLPWFTCQPSRVETLDSLPVYPDINEKASQFNSREESLFPIYECAPRKAVPVGPNYQADIQSSMPKYQKKMILINGSKHAFYQILIWTWYWMVKNVIVWIWGLSDASSSI
ncbi:uncharacterized protein LOC144559168 isoform X2 [Carex rostrata]